MIAAWQSRYPRRWSEMSFDMKLFMGLHLLAMILFMVGAALTIAGEAAIQGVAITAAVAMAIVRRRRRSGWRWPRPGRSQWLSALGALVVIVLFLGVVYLIAPPMSPQLFPWFIAGAQIGVFNILASLRLVRMKQSDVDADLQGEPAPLDAPPEAPAQGWRRHAPLAFYIAFAAVWLESLAFFFVNGMAMKHGAPAATPALPAPLTENGHTVYVAAHTAALSQALLIAMFVGIPAILVTGLLLHFVAGVRVFGNVPMRRPGVGADG